ncbi:hypothetical protein B5F88_14715, partial [Flavonifractor sp. An306]
MIGLYERGEADPSTETVCALADVFGVSTDYLLGRTDQGARACLKNQETCSKSTELQWRQGERRPRRRCPACRIW